MSLIPSDVPGFSGDALVRKYDGTFIRVADLTAGTPLEDGHLVALVVEMPARNVWCMRDPHTSLIDVDFYFAPYQPISSNAHAESRWVFANALQNNEASSTPKISAVRPQETLAEPASPKITFSIVLSPDTRARLGYGWVYLYSPEMKASFDKYNFAAPRPSSTFRSRFAVRATTLGHSMTEGILDHPFFGSWRCVTAIQHYDPEGACLTGYVRLNNATFVTGAPPAGCKAVSAACGGEIVVDMIGALPMGYERPKRIMTETNRL
jgi:hypothetical protein